MITVKRLNTWAKRAKRITVCEGNRVTALPCPDGVAVGVDDNEKWLKCTVRIGPEHFDELKRAMDAYYDTYEATAF